MHIRRSQGGTGERSPPPKFAGKIRERGKSGKNSKKKEKKIRERRKNRQNGINRRIII